MTPQRSCRWSWWAPAGLATAVVASHGCHLAARIDELEPRDPVTPTEAIEVLWVKRLGDGSDQWISAVAVDRNDDLLVAGMFKGTIELGDPPISNAGVRDPFVAKLGGDGTGHWSRAFGEPETIVVTGLAVGASSEPIVTGYFSGSLSIGGDLLVANGLADGFVAMLDASGEARWARRFGDDAYQRSLGVAVTAGGSAILLAGEFKGTMVFDEPSTDGTITSAGGFDAFLSKYTSRGEHAWAERFGDSEDQQAGAIVLDGANDVYLAGTAYGAVDLAGVTRASQGSADLFLAKLGSGPAHLWSATFGDADRNCQPDCEVALAASPDGAVVMAAAFTGHVEIGSARLQGEALADLLLAKFDERGDGGVPRLLWAKQFGGALTQRPYGLAVAPDGTIALAGIAGGTVDFGGGEHHDADYAKDAFVAFFEPDGSHRSSIFFPITSAEVADDDEPRSPRVAFDSAGDLFVVGAYRGTIEIADEQLVSAGAGEDYDAYVVKLRAARP